MLKIFVCVYFISTVPDPVTGVSVEPAIHSAKVTWAASESDGVHLYVVNIKKPDGSCMSSVFLRDPGSENTDTKVSSSFLMLEIPQKFIQNET